MYKLIFIDLDGTLLNDEKEISKENIDAINKAYDEKGVISVITTGRPYVCAKHLGDIVGEYFTKYVIASTGSAIRDNITNKFLVRNMISNKDTRKIMEITEKYGFRRIVDIESKVLINNGLVSMNIYEKIGQPYSIKQNIKEYFAKSNAESMSITLTGDEEKLYKAIEELKQVDSVNPTEICKYSVKTSEGIRSNTYIDIIRKESTKQNAIMLLADYLKVSKEEIIVIGDGGNDLPMFNMAGLKIAMENGLDIVKEKADYITCSNNESGVAKAINKFIFEGGSNG